MIPLPSGQLTGISHIRARYHALRLNRLVGPSTSHRDLYGFVDIVVKPDSLKNVPYDPPFLFSGYTLADLSQLHWPRSDRRAFEDWIKQAQQIREIDQVRKRINADEPALGEVEYHHPKQLYSCLQKRISQLSMHRASPDQWRRTLLNMTRSGIRKEELTWSGLVPYLAKMTHEGHMAITRDQLLSQIDFSIIRLSLTNEIVTDPGRMLEFMEIPTSKSINHSITPKTITEPSDCCVLRYVDPVHYYKVGYLKKQKSWNGVTSSQQWFALDSMGNPVGDETTNQHLFAIKEQAFSNASRHALQHLGIPVDHSHYGRYEHKSLFGGNDYREWLVSLPDYPLSHFTSHYYTRNLLVHFRTKQRIDTQGKRLLFIEEIQSDWHQSGAMYGYQNRWPGRITPAPFRKEWLSLALKLLLLHATEHDYDAIAWTGGDIQESHYFKKLSTVKRLYDNEIPRALGRLCEGLNLAIGKTKITTKEPRLHIARHWDKWFLRDETGSFYTKPRYTQQEAMEVLSRHCKQIDLEVPVMTLTQVAKERVRNLGFPLFGEKAVE
ncbi:MAG: hypothetical protein PVI97_15285 [Candidatus Thiodiazotropha sp.]|jgi:hypothetical protein